MWLFRSGLFLFAYVVMNIYTGIRFLTLVRYFFPSLKALVFWPIYLIFCYSFVLIMLLRLGWLRPLRQGAMNSLPALVYFFFALLVLDLIRLVYRLLRHAPLSQGLSAAFTGLALGLTVLVMIYGAFVARSIRPTHYEITLKKNPGQDVLRIALISDLHIGTVVGRKWLANIVDAANRTEPDIICIAGDIFDNNINAIQDVEGVARELRRFNAPLGVYACPGNHDVDRISFGGTNPERGGTDNINNFLKGAGILLLQDEVLLITDSFYLAGRRDIRPIGGLNIRKSAVELIEGIDKSKPLIVMDHQPVDFPGIEDAGADLILSGHTHKGQFFPGNIATARIFKEAGAVHYGYWQGNSAQAVVTSGAGVWGPPIRVATRSEVSVIDVRTGE
ncbi:MAG: metallophosphoesterase [Treponema sp.]|jgi:predicted MPP superfamily phosphohydrolase|nr:metallophosphoesterase [Treponema sp.]